MSHSTLQVHPAYGPEHRLDTDSLSASGVRLGALHRSGGQPAPNTHDLWCSVAATGGAVLAGAVVNVRPSRKIPWLHLGRIRHGQIWVDALLGAHPADALEKVRGALRAADGRLARLSVHVYCVNEERLAMSETALELAGWHREPAERDYQRTSLVSMQGDADALLARLAYSARRGIRGAEKGGWDVRRITNPALAPRLQALHEQAHDRTGGHAVVLDLAAAVHGSMADPTGSAVFGVYHPLRTGNEALVGFVHGLVTGDSVIYSTAGTERAEDIGAAPLGYGLVWALMRWAQELEVPWFDFGGITPEDQPEHPLARISEFKRKFRGAEQRIASDWYMDVAPMQARLLELSAKAAAVLRPR